MLWTTNQPVKLQGKKVMMSKDNKQYLILNLSDPENGNSTCTISVSDTELMTQVLQIKDDTFVLIEKSEIDIVWSKGSYKKIVASKITPLKA